MIQCHPSVGGFIETALPAHNNHPRLWNIIVVLAAGLVIVAIGAELDTNVATLHTPCRVAIVWNVDFAGSIEELVKEHIRLLDDFHKVFLKKLGHLAQLDRVSGEIKIVSNMKA